MVGTMREKLETILLTKLNQMPWFFPILQHKNNVVSFKYNILTEFTRIDLKQDHIFG